MKYIKLLICILLCLSISFTTLCGCLDDGFLLDLVDTNKKSAEAEAFEALEETQKVELLVSEMEKAFSSGKRTVKFGFDCSEYLFDAYKTVHSNKPQFFWLTRSSSYEITTVGVNSSIVFEPKINLKDEEISSMQKQIDDVTKSILLGIEADATDYQKVLYIHDYIVDNTVYDSNSADAVLDNEEEENLPQSVQNSTGIYGCLVNKLAICSGYAATFKYLSDKVGLECIRVSGTAKESGESHQWNCVKVDGDFYYIDTTFDDKLHKEPTEHSKDYEYFLITEQELLLTHTIKEDEAVPECTAEKYNYFIYNGLYLKEYSFELFSTTLKSKMPAEKISVKFGSGEECQKAYDDLFEGEKRFWEISGVKAKAVTTSVSESGKILNIKF